MSGRVNQSFPGGSNATYESLRRHGFFRLTNSNPAGPTDGPSQLRVGRGAFWREGEVEVWPGSIHPRTAQRLPVGWRPQRRAGALFGAC